MCQIKTKKKSNFDKTSSCSQNSITNNANECIFNGYCSQYQEQKLENEEIEVHIKVINMSETEVYFSSILILNIILFRY